MTRKEVLAMATEKLPNGWCNKIYRNQHDPEDYLYLKQDENSWFQSDDYKIVCQSSGKITDEMLAAYESGDIEAINRILYK